MSSPCFDLELSITTAKKSRNALEYLNRCSDDELSNFRNDFGETLLQTALLPDIDNDYIATMMYDRMSLESLNNIDNDGRHALEYALHHPILFRGILKKGVNPNFCTSSGTSIFAMVAEYGYLDLLRWLHNEYPEIDINATECGGDSPLDLAALNDHRKVVEYLLSIKCDLTDYFMDSFVENYTYPLKTFYTTDEDNMFFVRKGAYHLLPDRVKDLFLF